MIAKYLDNEDTYLSVIEALKSAAWQEGVGLNIKWLNAEGVAGEDLESVDGIVVPGGFGDRGVSGKIAAANYALDNKVPYLGICLGLQTAVIAAAHRGGLPGATSTEFNAKAKDDVIYMIDGQLGKGSTGGTLRLGDYESTLKPGSVVAKAYGAAQVTERHRHRYEVNQKYLAQVNAGGLVVSGTSPDGKLVEYVEAPDHPYFVATQAHPEFKSRPHRAHPLFTGLVGAAIKSKFNG